MMSRSSGLLTPSKGDFPSLYALLTRRERMMLHVTKMISRMSRAKRTVLIFIERTGGCELRPKHYHKVCTSKAGLHTCKICYSIFYMCAASIAHPSQLTSSLANNFLYTVKLSSLYVSSSCGASFWRTFCSSSEIGADSGAAEPRLGGAFSARFFFIKSRILRRSASLK